ncbi:MAG: enolase [Nanoarchaeota archaeon]|nr:enolase [Nanoarchaeota archaeon]
MNVKKILNSRGEETVEVNYNGFIGSAPSGASKGKKEVKDYIKSIDEEIKELKKLKIEDVNTFSDLKNVEDLTKNFGGNSRIALEFAIFLSNGGYKWLKGRKLPRPLGNVIGGGKHIKNGNLVFQEYLVIDGESESFFDSAFKNLKFHRFIHEKLEHLDKENNRRMTDEGAWSPNLSDEEVLDLLSKYAKKFKLKLGIDMAADSFFDGEFYVYKDKKLNRDEQIKYVNYLIKKYNLYYVEDPLQEDDFEGFSFIDKRALVCGDDLVVTNLKRLRKAIENNSINSLIVKPNQIGSLIKMREVIIEAKKKNIIPVISHRSGETLDYSISDLAVGFEIPIIKCGIFGKEREAKLNRLVKIEKEILNSQ